jgi:hypothetical protein
MKYLQFCLDPFNYGLSTLHDLFTDFGAMGDITLGQGRPTILNEATKRPLVDKLKCLTKYFYERI